MMTKIINWYKNKKNTRAIEKNNGSIYLGNSFGDFYHSTIIGDHYLAFTDLEDLFDYLNSKFNNNGMISFYFSGYFDNELEMWLLNKNREYIKE